MRRAGAERCSGRWCRVRVAGGVAEGERRRREASSGVHESRRAAPEEKRAQRQARCRGRRRAAESRTTMTVDGDGDGGGEDCAATAKGFDRVVWAEKGRGGWVFQF
ncbi:hypothetical protein Scep_028268 [Stephania cephalantha]|uniref:Uncharacterized protein n=1 Tax=Stephania cephalantha TaxID=152367 RepID=A0AAP0E9M6_9MAGN